MDRLTVKTALALALLELLTFVLGLLIGFATGFVMGRIAVRRRLGFLAGMCAGVLSHHLPGESPPWLSRQPYHERSFHDDDTSRDLVPAALSLEHWWGTCEPVRNVGNDRETYLGAVRKKIPSAILEGGEGGSP